MMRIESVRPLVRYVDESQAVVDATVTMRLDHDRAAAQLLVTIRGEGGFHDECLVKPGAMSDRVLVRMDLVQPERWWPASMGAQPLYELNVQLLASDLCVDEKTVTFGLTSIRAGVAASAEPCRGELLVNGQVCDIQHVVTVDRINERQLLPATGDSLLVVRDHYGPDVLYQAADRVGILLVQCVPIHVEATPEADVAAEVDRLAAHPSLAGWFVGHLGRVTDMVAEHIARVDPTRAIFRRMPVAC